MTGPPSSFGDMLRCVRIAAGLTQEALAERAGLSVRGISDLERGVNRTPRRDTVELLAEALRLSGDDRAAFAAAGSRLPRTVTTSTPIRPPENLPTPLTSLVGRAGDIAAATQLLAMPGVRLVTLTGPGGVGKTRLAVQLARELGDSAPDGVRFVRLASVSDPGLVAAAIAQVLDLSDAGDVTLHERLIGYLRSKRLLLILDNFEHLLPAATLVTELLGECPGLTVLTTSRAPLRVSGEHEFEVLPLAVPDLLHLPQGSDLARYPAIRLFLERARAVSPDFEITPANAAAVATICAQVDGLPLALELAAARIKLLPPELMVTRLERRLQVLTSGPRDAPARQRTLRDTLAWSFNLLSPSEQRLFRCLAVFAGGWILDAAEAVCDAMPTDFRPQRDTAERDPVGSTLDGLAALVDNNLVRPIVESGQVPRFMMLETVGEFAREQLAASGNERAYRWRHAHVFLELAEQLESKLRTSQRLAWRDRLAADAGNLRAAVNWTITSGETEWAMRLTAAIYWPWLQLGHFREGRQWCEAALALPGADRSLSRARTLLAAGSFAWHQGEPVAAWQWLIEGETLCAELGDRQGLGLAAQFLGLLALSQGEYTRAHVHLTESVALFREIADDWNLANALFILGDIVAKDDPESARTLYEESLARFRHLGDPWGIAWPLTGLGGLALRRGEYAMARERFTEGLKLRRELRDRWGVAISLTSLGEAARKEGDSTGAETYLTEGLALFREVGDQERVAWALHNLGRVAEEQGKTTSAGAHFAESLALRGEQAHHPGMASSLAGLGRVAAKMGELARATRLLAVADALCDAGVGVEPDERRENEQLREMLRTNLGPRSFAVHWAAGRELRVEHVAVEADRRRQGGTFENLA